MTVLLLGSFGSGSIIKAKNGGTGEKNPLNSREWQNNISTQMVKQDLCGGVFHIRFPRMCGIEQRTTRNQVLKNL